MPNCRPNLQAETESTPLTTPAGSSPWQLRQAALTIRAGGVVAYPTEAVYGLGCDPLDGAAVRRIFQLKGRTASKGVILIAADLAQLRPFLAPLNDIDMAPILASWPGPNTWIMPAATALPAWLNGGMETIAVRVTAHPLSAALCRASGMPLVSTSANPAGRRPARSALEVRRYFGEELEMIVNGALGEQAQPSRIRDARTGAVLR
ncbi:MAG: L-threonylcarbamoyladenylate synthase [Gammaproteobacteria bacterium]|nr:L-threonylcarbamoyladenylate synthase [Gammaproteobacteria bacterium]